MPMPGYTQVDVSIAAGASKSGFISVVGYEVVGILVPASTEGDYIRFYADAKGDDDTGAIVVNTAGEEVRAIFGTLPTVVSLIGHQGTNIAPIPVCGRVAVETGSGGSVTNQSGAPATITLLLRQIGPGIGG